MTPRRESDGDSEPSPNTYAMAPVDRVRPFLEAVYRSKRDVPGDTEIRVSIGKWVGWIPLYELGGVLERLR